LNIFFYYFSIDITDQDEVCRAFKETFHSYGIRVPATLVQVNAFVHPDMRVEIEADAIIM
jgi:enamine deaminase RidA (YjgF/YER057c/UK114 family)